MVHQLVRQQVLQYAYAEPSSVTTLPPATHLELSWCTSLCFRRCLRHLNVPPCLQGCTNTGQQTQQGGQGVRLPQPAA